MITKLGCIPCIVNSIVNLLKQGKLNEQDKEQVIRRLFSFLSEADYKQSPPSLGRDIHRIIREQLNDPDPYEVIKREYNIKLMEMYSKFDSMVKSEKDPFDMAMRLAVAGNVIDYGPQYQLDIMETINRVVNSKIAIDDSKSLRNDLEYADKLLYIGDNCGEIVLDKLFLETINLPNMYFAVRGGPVLNDVTIKEAKFVGLDKIAEIITTGDDAPGVVLDSTSDTFKQIFNEADVIISKGQGNLEGLTYLDQNIYFLLVVKCDLIGNIIGAQKGEFVVKKNRL